MKKARLFKAIGVLALAVSMLAGLWGSGRVYAESEVKGYTQVEVHKFTDGRKDVEVTIGHPYLTGEELAQFMEQLKAGYKGPEGQTYYPKYYVKHYAKDKTAEVTFTSDVKVEGDKIIATLTFTEAEPTPPGKPEEFQKYHIFEQYIDADGNLSDKGDGYFEAKPSTVEHELRVRYDAMLQGTLLQALDQEGKRDKVDLSYDMKIEGTDVHVTFKETYKAEQVPADYSVKVQYKAADGTIKDLQQDFWHGSLNDVKAGLDLKYDKEIGRKAVFTVSYDKGTKTFFVVIEKAVLEDIEYKVQTIKTDKLEKGKTEVARKGVKGKLNPITGEVEVKPVDEIVNVGTKETPVKPEEVGQFAVSVRYRYDDGTEKTLLQEYYEGKPSELESAIKRDYEAKVKGKATVEVVKEGDGYAVILSKAVLEDIDYKVQTVKTDKLEKGKTEVARKGVKGKLNPITGEVEVKPVDEIVNVGTKEAPVKPADPTTKPVDPTTKPVDPTTKPVATTAKPVATTAKPVATTTKSAAKPVATTTKSTTKPAATATKPAAKSTTKRPQQLARTGEESTMFGAIVAVSLAGALVVLRRKVACK